MSVQIESDLKEILTRFEQRFDKLDQKLDKLNDNTTDINLRLTKVETKLDAATEDIREIKSTQKALSTDVSDLKGAKSLIIPILVAVTTSILTLIIRTIPIS
ncbi:shikimate dehydrogenase [Pleurocapsa sp. CCALA 161]|uniref:shikimate dehydrogenase n=1 Tax=Pleurocapsa sp. CCALA 161 TaxID=2107688 RepID=UPI000D066D45|nr:shikimate dehydrogenase [Pleurocapsa sp. CCALA 161]PSB09767.1 shikimate dehydrogenase [Pleurocapsa sp. CCALA 161]